MEGKRIMEVSEWISKALLGVIAEDDRQRLDSWVNESEHNRVLLHAIRNELLKKHTSELSEKEADEAYERFLIHRKYSGKPIRRTLSLFLKYVAVLVFPIMLGVGVWLLRGKEPEKSNKITSSGAYTTKPILTLADGREILIDKAYPGLTDIPGVEFRGKDSVEMVYVGDRKINAEPEYHILSTPAQCDYHFMLADGSKVWINAKSSVKYPVQFDGNKRVIYVAGEVYLEVVKDSLRPFYVMTDEMKIEVRGTAFNVNAYPDENQTTVTLANGQIAVYTLSDVCLLSPGEQVSVQRSDHRMEVRKVDPGMVIAWKNGLYYFKGQTLQEVARVLKRWYDVDFVFDNVLVQYTLFTGVVKKEESIEAFIRIINEISSFKCSLKGKTLYIK